MGMGGGGGSQAAGYQLGSYWSPGGLPSGYSVYTKNLAIAAGVYAELLVKGVSRPITAGKTFYVTGIVSDLMNNTTGVSFAQVGYADDAAGTGFVNLMTLGANAPSIPAYHVEYNLVTSIPAGKYVVALSDASYATYGLVMVQGYEV